MHSCSAGSLQQKKSTFAPYISKGFALVYDEKDYVKISVIDTGFGINKED